VRYAASDKLLSRGKACGALFGALVLAFIHCFRIALVTICCIPFLVSGGILRQRAVQLASGQQSFKYSQVFAADSIKNIHTVISIGAISKFLGKYSDLLNEPETKTVRFAPIRGLMLGAGMAAIFGAFALNLWFSAVNVNKGWCTLGDSTTALLCVIFGGIRSGAFLGEAPDKNAGIKAAKLVQQLLMDNELDTPASGALGTAAEPITTAGKIEFKNVSFSYPSRPDAPVLDSFSMTINPGEMVALVGSSGSGKSTIMSLLNQFYLQNSGQILVDGADLSLYATAHLRQAVGLVDQDPHLFSTTVANNVAYGTGTTGSVADDEPAIWGALESANAKDFVGELSDGLQTHVGKFGSKLSGGQRQRVVISRLFIRGEKVKVLLLDEATSALDSKSEQLVQEGIERLRQGKTTLVIAHRLSTVQAADRIIVLNEGKVLEQGTHQELYDARAAYFQLVQNQMIGRRPSTVTPADLQTSTTA
jgi:ABC-type multidrug transport system fused ATPase/permease subunit